MPGDKEIEALHESLKEYKSQIETVTKGTLTWDKDLIFMARTQRGYEVDYDAHKQWGPSPTETLLLSLAGCIGIDCVMFLQKMKVELTSFKIDISGVRKPDPPQYYTDMEMTLYISGDNISEKKVQRAINLSQEKYCGVRHSLRKDMNIKIDYIININEED